MKERERDGNLGHVGIFPSLKHYFVVHSASVFWSDFPLPYICPVSSCSTFWFLIKPSPLSVVHLLFPNRVFFAAEWIFLDSILMVAVLLLPVDPYRSIDTSNRGKKRKWGRWNSSARMGHRSARRKEMPWINRWPSLWRVHSMGHPLLFVSSTQEFQFVLCLTLSIMFPLPALPAFRWLVPIVSLGIGYIVFDIQFTTFAAVVPNL